MAEALELTGGVRGVSGGAGVAILFDLASEALQSRRLAHAPGFGGSGQGDGASDEPSVVLSSFPPPPLSLSLCMWTELYWFACIDVSTCTCMYACIHMFSYFMYTHTHTHT